MLERPYRDNADLLEELAYNKVKHVVLLMNYEDGEIVTLAQLKKRLKEDDMWDLSVESGIVYINVMED